MNISQYVLFISSIINEQEFVEKKFRRRFSFYDFFVSLLSPSQFLFLNFFKSFTLFVSHYPFSTDNFFLIHLSHQNFMITLFSVFYLPDIFLSLSLLFFSIYFFSILFSLPISFPPTTVLESSAESIKRLVDGEKAPWFGTAEETLI